MGERHSCVGSHSERRGYARDYFEGNAGTCKRFGLLPAPPENERIATLESNHGQAPPCTIDQHPANLLLGVGMRGLFLADI